MKFKLKTYYYLYKFYITIFIEDHVQRVYYNLKYTKTKIIRAIQYAIIGYNSHDYDYSALFELINYKMERMHKAFIEDITMFGLFNKREFRSLKLCIKLYKKFEYSKNVDSVYKRWGSPEIDRSHSPHISLTHKKANTPETKAILNRELTAAHSADEAYRKRARDLYFKIFEKYHRKWWS